MTPRQRKQLLNALLPLVERFPVEAILRTLADACDMRADRLIDTSEPDSNPEADELEEWSSQIEMFVNEEGRS